MIAKIKSIYFSHPDVIQIYTEHSEIFSIKGKHISFTKVLNWQEFIIQGTAFRFEFKNTDFPEHFCMDKFIDLVKLVLQERDSVFISRWMERE